MIPDTMDGYIAKIKQPEEMREALWAMKAAGWEVRWAEMPRGMGGLTDHEGHIVYMNIWVQSARNVSDRLQHEVGHVLKGDDEIDLSSMENYCAALFKGEGYAVLYNMTMRHRSGADPFGVLEGRERAAAKPIWEKYLAQSAKDPKAAQTAAAEALGKLLGDETVSERAKQWKFIYAAQYRNKVNPPTDESPAQRIGQLP